MESQWRVKNPELDKEMRWRESQKNRISYKKREDAYWKRLKQKHGARYVTILRTEASSRRRNSEVRATPKWYNKQKVISIYKKRDRMFKKTGILHHVDHIIPLRHKHVCGLHWHLNLQILTKAKNQSKTNHFDV